MRINKVPLMLLVIVLLISSVGCSETIWTKEHEFTFSQSVNNVTSVKIVRYDDEETRSIIEVIKTLNDDEAEMLLTDFTATSCRKHFGDHGTYYGDILVCISYENQEVDVIGPENCATIDENGVWSIGNKYFDDVDFCDIVLRYVDRELVPELERYLQ